jgi:DNA-binding CsgD family transcriptional regulator
MIFGWNAGATLCWLRGRIVNTRSSGASTGLIRRLASFAGVVELTPAERRVTEELLRGHTTAEIANDLFVSEATIRTHLTHIYGKLNVRGRVELLAIAADDGTSFQPPIERRGRAPSVIASACLILVLTAFTNALATISLLGWTLIGPVFIAVQPLLALRGYPSSVRIATAMVGGWICVQQFAVLIALHMHR